MEPQFAIVEDDRLPYAWPTVFTLFAFIIGLVLLSYFGAPKPTKRELITETESHLRTEILIQAVQDYFGAKPNPHSKVEDVFPKDLQPYRNSDLEVAELYVVTLFQETGKVTPADLKPIDDVRAKLSRKATSTDVAFEQIYQAKSLTRDEANNLINRISGNAFLYQVARMHAREKAKLRNPTSEMVPFSRVVMFMVVGGTFLFAMMSGIILWITYFVARNSGKLVPLGHPAGWLTAGGADRYALRTAQYLGVYLVVSFMFSLLRRQLNIPAVWSETLAAFVFIGMLPLFVFIPVGGKRILPRFQGWTTDNLLKNIGWGLAASLANIPVFLSFVLLGSAIFQGFPTPEHPVITQLTTRTNFLTAILLTLIASISAPIFEETLFRGTFLPALSTRFGSITTGIIISSLFFAALHPTGPPSWLALGGIAALSALLTYQTKSLIPSVIMHSAFNFGQVLLLLTLR